MSYVRFGEDGSDVYIFEHVDGYVDCCFCGLNKNHPEEDDFNTTDLASMLEHFAAHRAAGHHVPRWVDDALRTDWPQWVP